MEKEIIHKLQVTVQGFLWLLDWDIITTFSEDIKYMGCLLDVDYKRFQAHIDFSTGILSENESFAIKIIMHELCHIFTISSLKEFERDEYIKQYIGAIQHNEAIVRMDILNEQMTVRLERLLTKHFYISNPSFYEKSRV